MMQQVDKIRVLGQYYGVGLLRCEEYLLIGCVPQSKLLDRKTSDPHLVVDE